MKNDLKIKSGMPNQKKIELIESGVPVYDIVLSTGSGTLIDAVNELIVFGLSINVSIKLVGGMHTYMDSNISLRGLVYAQTIVWKKLP